MTTPGDELRTIQGLIAGLDAIVWEADARSCEWLFVSEGAAGILGHRPRDWLAHPTFWADHLHPDDRERAIRGFTAAAAQGLPFDTEYRLVAKDGAYVWLRDLGHVERDDQGRPSRVRGLMVEITRTKQLEERHREAEARAAESEARYRSLVERLPVIVYSEPVVGTDLMSMYISPRIEDVLGVTAQEWMEDPDLWYETIHPDDRARVRAEDERTEASGAPFSIEYRSVARDGRTVWFRDEARLVRDDLGAPLFWQGVMFDVTAERDAQQLLSEAEARFRALVEHTPAITYIDALAGPDPAIYISPQTTEVLGYTPEEWYGDPDLWSKIVFPEDNDRDEHVDAEGIHSSEYRIVAKDGRIVWVHDQSSLITDDQGDPRFWQGVLVDVTQQKRTEQLEQDLAVERETAQKLRDLDDMKNTFLQAVSHDLRTPLAAILGLAVTMGREDLDIDPTETREMSRRIAVNARRLDRLVNDLLDLDRLSRGIVEPTLRPTDLGALIRNLVSESDLMAERRVNLEMQPITIPVDAAKVERIVENLLANTTRHTPVEAQLWVRIEPMGQGAVIVVEDDGPGVPEDERDRIFEPFLQGPSMSEHSPGVGVGLTLVARFAELHGGRAWVQERPGGGASFRVYLSGAPVDDVADAGGG